MKTILATILTLFLACGLFAQDLDTTVTRGYFKDTLTATLDTMNIGLYAQDTYEDIIISTYTTTGTDTFTVWNPSPDGSFYSQVGVRDLSTGWDSTRVIIGTTPKQFSLFHPFPMKIRLVTEDASASTVFIISGRKKY